MSAEEMAGYIATELALHMSDLADDEQPFDAGTGVAYFEDTHETGEPNSVYVQLRDGLRFKVTVEHAQPEVRLGDKSTEGTEPMTPEERAAFEDRADFPGWDAL